MGDNFKPLEDIAEDDSIRVGDLFILRELPSGSNCQSTTKRPVYCGMMENFTVDTDNCGIEKGRQFWGLRVFHYEYNGSLKGDRGPSVFHDEERGLLIPFNIAQKYEYALPNK